MRSSSSRPRSITPPTSPWTPGARQKRSPAAEPFGVRVYLGGLSLLALGLRLWSIDFGLPAIYRPDEDVVVGRAMGVLQGTLDPHFADWPHADFYLSAIWLAVTTPLRVLGREPAVDYLAVRVLTAILGALTVLVVYAIGRRAFDTRTGLLAATGMSVAFLAVRDSHFATIDIPLTLVCSLTLLAMLRAMSVPLYVSLPLGAWAGYSPLPPGEGQGRGWRWGWNSLAPGVLLGLATGVKYTGAFLAASILAGYRRRLLLTAVIGLAVFAATSPFLLLDPAGFGRGLMSIAHHLGQPGAGEIGWIHLGRLALWHGLDPVLFVLALAGIVVAVLRRSRADWILLSFIFATYAIVGAGSSVFVRYADPLLPPLLVLAGRAVAEALNATSVRIAPLLAALLIAVPSLPHDVAYDTLIGRVDTRTMAFEWLAAQVPPGDRIATGYFPGPAHDAALVAGGRHSHGAPTAYEAAFLQNRPQDRYGVHELTQDELDSGALAILRADGVHYVVITPMLPDIACRPPSPLEQQLRAMGPPVAVFLPGSDTCAGSVFDPIDAYFVPLSGYHGWAHPGPPIRIYRLP